METSPFSPAAQRLLAGTSAVITGVSGALGQAVARHLAATCRALLLADASAEDARAIRADVQRVRQLHGIDGEAVFIEADVSDGAQAARVLREAREAFGDVEAVVACGALAVGYAGGDGAGCAPRVVTDSFGGVARAAETVLGAQGQGALVVAALVRGAWPGRLGVQGQQAALAHLGAFTHAEAAHLHTYGFTACAVALEDPAHRDALASLGDARSAHAVRADRQRRAPELHHAAHAAGFLASGAARGLTGQVFFIGDHGPAAPTFAARDMARATA